MLVVVATAIQAGIMVWSNSQTERVIAKMELEQRAWLATSADPIRPVEDLRKLTKDNFKDFAGATNWKVRLRNSGNTPAVLKYSRVGWLPSERWQAHNKDFWRDDLTKQAVSRPQHTVIAPGDSLVFGMQDINQGYAVPLDTEMRMKQWVGARLVGIFIYEDVFGKQHTTFCSYRYNSTTEELDNHLEDGYMD